MLLFTFVVTINTHAYSNNPKNIIYEYYDFKNSNDIESISKLLYNKNRLNPIQEQLKYINEIKIISIREYKTDSLLSLYSNTIGMVNSDTKVKAYNVEYSIIYNEEYGGIYKSGEYESLMFLLKDNNSTEWLLDPYDFY